MAAGANLIITHEPTFYSHLDRLDALESARDPVTAAKRAYIREHGLVVGEPREWETVPYVADAIAQGRAKGLIVLGHVPSEAVGSEAVMRWMREAAPGVKVVRVEAKDPFWRP